MTETPLGDPSPLPGLAPLRRVLLAVTLLVMLGHVVMLVWDSLYLLELRPGWFWCARETPLPAAWLLLPLLVSAVAAARRVGATPPSLGSGAGALVLLGIALELGFCAAQGRGLAPFRELLSGSGHSEFVRIATSPIAIPDVLFHYERLLDELHLVYPRSKPPGQVLFYQVLERVVNVGTAEPDRASRFQSALSVIFPCLTALVVLPLVALGRRLLGAIGALSSTLLFLVAPSTILVTMHLDGALYPTLAVSVVLLGAHALDPEAPHRSGAWFAALAGALYFVATWISFSLGPVVVLAAAPALPALIGTDSARRNHMLRRLGVVLPVWLGSVLVPLVMARLILGYDALGRFERAMAFHAAWKRVPPRATAWDIAVTNGLDWALWLGVPLVGALVAGVLVALWRLRRRALEAVDAVALLLAGVLVALAFQRGTVGETARLWLYLGPFATLVAFRGLHALFPGRLALALGVLVSLELGLAVCTLRYQTFF